MELCIIICLSNHIWRNHSCFQLQMHSLIFPIDWVIMKYYKTLRNYFTHSLASGLHILADKVIFHTSRLVLPRVLYPDEAMSIKYLHIWPLCIGFDTVKLEVVPCCCELVMWIDNLNYCSKSFQFYLSIHVTATVSYLK